MKPAGHLIAHWPSGALNSLSYSRVKVASLFGISNWGTNIPGGKNVQSNFQESLDEKGTELSAAGQTQWAVSD